MQILMMMMRIGTCYPHEVAKDVHERALGTKLKRRACKVVQCKQVGRIWFWQVREGRRGSSQRLQRGFKERLPGGGRAGSGGRMGVRGSGDLEAREGRGLD